ncbi:MAG: rhodanese-like domain-containing protein [Nitrospirota bacterium]
MTIKWKKVAFDVIIIMVVAIFIGFLANELRANKVSLVPSHIKSLQYQTISINEFSQFQHTNFSGFIFDARPHNYYEKNHLPNSVNFPVSEFDFFYSLYLANVSIDTPIFIYGRTLSQTYDLELAHRLSLKGYRNITVISEA